LDGVLPACLANNKEQPPTGSVTKHAFEVIIVIGTMDA